MSPLQSQYTAPNARRLFAGSCVAVSVIGLAFAVRGDTFSELSRQFALTHTQMGWIASAAFWGFVLSMIVGGQLCDWLGMGRILRGASLFHIAGVVLTIAASGFWTLWAGTLFIGMGNALVEAAVNPLIATIYTDRKTEKINGVHAWYPWGIVIGGLAAFLLTWLHCGWQIKVVFLLLPVAGYSLIFRGQKFPQTERVQRGVRTSDMYREALRGRFVLWVICMLLTASTELSPNQWIPAILTQTTKFPGILILAWINSLMAVGRMLAGKLVHRLSPLGLLMVAAALSAIGLFSLSFAESGATALAASTVFALGVCYFWPTMLGITAEWFPNGGALLLAIVGGAGNLSVALTLPIIGRIYDVSGPHLALREVAILPLVLIAIFSALRFTDARPSKARLVT
jgi:fucose permease